MLHHIYFTTSHSHNIILQGNNSIVLSIKCIIPFFSHYYKTTFLLNKQDFEKNFVFVKKNVTFVLVCVLNLEKILENKSAHIDDLTPTAYRNRAYLAYILLFLRTYVYNIRVFVFYFIRFSVRCVINCVLSVWHNAYYLLFIHNLGLGGKYLSSVLENERVYAVFYSITEAKLVQAYAIPADWRSLLRSTFVVFRKAWVTFREIRATFRKSRVVFRKAWITFREIRATFRKSRVVFRKAWVTLCELWVNLTTNCKCKIINCLFFRPQYWAVLHLLVQLFGSNTNSQSYKIIYHA